MLPTCFFEVKNHPSTQDIRHDNRVNGNDLEDVARLGIYSNSKAICSVLVARVKMTINFSLARTNVVSHVIRLAVYTSANLYLDSDDWLIEVKSEHVQRERARIRTLGSRRPSHEELYSSKSCRMLCVG